jgi:hypothetical protein
LQNTSKVFGFSIERVVRLTKYGRFWTLVRSIYTRAKTLIFIILLLIILIIAYLLIPDIEGLLGNAHNLFVFILGVGVFILFFDGLWFVNYRKRVAFLAKMSHILPTQCPFCGKNFQVDRTDRKMLFGLPGARLDFSCESCGTHLVSDYPFHYWTFTKIDPVLNSTFAWLYQGERLSREDIRLIQNKKHAEKAKVKLRASGNPDLEYVWFDKPTARAITRLRTGPLEQIISGNMSALSELSADILRTPPEVNTSFFKQPSDLVLHKDENVLLYVAPVRLAAQRTNQGEHEFHTKDTGFFFVTNQRVGFRGRTYRTNLTIKAIDDLDHQSDKIVIRPQRRKTPDYYLDLDGELVYCVIIGLLNTNEIS